MGKKQFLGPLAFCLTLSMNMNSDAGAAAAELPADLVMRGATVLTMDPAMPLASALAVRKGEIVYVGDDAGVAEFIGPKTRVMAPATGNRTDQAGPFTVLPGLADAHAHLSGLGFALQHLDLRGDTSPAAVIDKVQAAAKEPYREAASEWILGRGWDQNRYTPPVLPSLADLQALDAAAPSRPVILRRIDGHAAWVNSEALRRAGIDRQTQEVPGGRIVRDESGAPTGVLIDNAMALVEKLVPPPREAEFEAAILKAATYAASRGLTAVHDMGVGPEEVAIYRRLAQSGQLPLRVFAYLADPIPQALAQLPHSAAYKDELKRLARRLGPPEIGPLFTLRGIKLYMDGALGSRGAALRAPYSDEPRSSGLLLAPPEHIEEMARWARVHGYQIATHAIGDRANHLVLDAYQNAGVTAGLNLRFRIEHAQVLLPEDLSRRRFLELGVIASVQPSHATSDMPWVGVRLGPERLSNAYAWRALLRSGARLCAGSDFPVEEADARLILHAAVTRTDINGQPKGGFFAVERLSIGEAIRAMTHDAAYAVFAEDRLGQIAVGRPADLTVLGGTLSLAPGAAPPEDLLRRKILLTIVGGNVVHDELLPVRPKTNKRPLPGYSQPKR